jgi:DNA-binding IclR family transcriptional regulator
MTAVLERAFGVIETLVGHPAGLSLGTIARQLEIPKSAAHRSLTELVDLGYVRQDAASGDYLVGLPVVSLGLRHLRSISLVEAATHALAELAEDSGELARLAIFDGESLHWVAKRQGARPGLRYDPDSGEEVILANTATGIAWLSSLPDEEATRRVTAQRHRRGDDGVSASELADLLDLARRQRFAFADGTNEVGLAGVAVAVAEPGHAARAALSVAGPSLRFGIDDAKAMVPKMTGFAQELAPLAEHELDGANSRWQ